MKVISVFGSSQIKPGTPEYVEAFQIGITLSNLGFTVMTGGYGGIMAAVSEGAFIEGGVTIGVVSDVFSDRKPNKWVKKLVTVGSFKERLFYLIENTDAYLIFSGGIGTLCEILFAWNMMQVGQIPKRPLIIFGPSWQPILKQFSQSTFITERDMEYIVHISEHNLLISYLTKLKNESIHH